MYLLIFFSGGAWYKWNMYMYYSVARTNQTNCIINIFPGRVLTFIFLHYCNAPQTVCCDYSRSKWLISDIVMSCALIMLIIICMWNIVLSLNIILKWIRWKKNAFITKFLFNTNAFCYIQDNKIIKVVMIDGEIMPTWLSDFL